MKMPDWFSSWYSDQLHALHEKLEDADWAHDVLQEAMETAGSVLGREKEWKTTVQARIAEIDDSQQRTPSPLTGWEAIPAETKEQIKAFRLGQWQPMTEGDATRIEQWLSPLLSDSPSNPNSLQKEVFLRLWRFLAGLSTPEEENQIRHWADAREDHLDAFEKRYAIWEGLGALPGWILPNPKAAWEGLDFAMPENLSPTRASKPWWTIKIAVLTLVLGTASWGIWTWASGSDADIMAAEPLESWVAIQVGGERAHHVWEDGQLCFEGEFQLQVHASGMFRIGKATLTFEPGMYRLAGSDRGNWSMEASEGRIRYSSGYELFLISPGTKLEHVRGTSFKVPE